MTTSCNLNDRAKRHARAWRGVAANQCTGAVLCTLVLYLYMLVCRLDRNVISSTDERSERRYDRVRLLRGNQDWVEKLESGRSLQLAGSPLGEYKRLCEVVMMCYSEQMKQLMVALV